MCCVVGVVGQLCASPSSGRWNNQRLNMHIRNVLTLDDVHPDVVHSDVQEQHGRTTTDVLDPILGRMASRAHATHLLPTRIQTVVVWRPPAKSSKTEFLAVPTT